MKMIALQENLNGAHAQTSVFSFGSSYFCFCLHILFVSSLSPTIIASIQESIERYVDEDRKVSQLSTIRCVEQSDNAKQKSIRPHTSSLYSNHQTPSDPSEDFFSQSFLNFLCFFVLF